MIKKIFLPAYFVKQSTFKSRSNLINFLFRLSRGLYTKWFEANRGVWEVSLADLSEYPKGSLGFELSKFCHIHGFELIPKHEHHDIYHLLSGYGTDSVGEIELQYFLLGNGKRSLYLTGVLIAGLLILPEFSNRYKLAFAKGKRSQPFHDWNFELYLTDQLTELKKKIGM